MSWFSRQVLVYIVASLFMFTGISGSQTAMANQVYPGLSADTVTCDGLVTVSYSNVPNPTQVDVYFFLRGQPLFGQDNFMLSETVSVLPGSGTISHQFAVPDGEFVSVVGAVQGGEVFGSAFVETGVLYCKGPQAELTFVSISADCSGLVTYTFDPTTIHPGDSASLSVFGGSVPFDSSGWLELFPGQSTYTYTFDPSSWNQYSYGVRIQATWGPETQGSTVFFQCGAFEIVTQPVDAAAACQQGGYLNWAREDDSGFKNVGQCVKYVANGGTLQPKQP